MSITVEPMNAPTASQSEMHHQENVNAYFDRETLYWKHLYSGGSGLLGEVIRDRQEAALRSILALRLPANSRVLEVGCGAGYMSLELARRSFTVEAIDASPDMVQTARANVKDMGLSDRAHVELGDVQDLPFDDGFFDLVVAIGVLPWVANPERAVAEVARVTKANGHALFTCANLFELRNLLDPWRYPFLRPVKLAVKDALVRSGLLPAAPSMRMQRRAAVDRQLERVGLWPTTRRTIGFGPFSVFGRPILPAVIAIPLHKRLQRLADRQLPLLRAAGMSYLVMTRRN